VDVAYLSSLSLTFLFPKTNHLRHPFPPPTSIYLFVPDHLHLYISTLSNNPFILNRGLNSFNSKMSSTLISTLAALFCLPCKPHFPHHTRNNKVFYNAYGRRLYLRPIMPPTTKRQSRREGTDGVRVGDGRESLVEGTDSVRAEAEEDLMNKPRKTENMVALSPQASSTETRASEDIRIIDAPTESSSSTQGLKSRTFSMEMTDALEALHRKEEEEVVQSMQNPTHSIQLKQQNTDDTQNTTNSKTQSQTQILIYQHPKTRSKTHHPMLH
jgi:hypothetical protein